MRFLSVCSGIEAASVAWNPLGWECAAVAEIDKAPCSVLKHHYPTVPNWGDLTNFEEWPDAVVNVLVGGTPCQSFSVAGKREGMGDARGQLAYSYAGVSAKYRPKWVVWENVRGVLSSNGGQDFHGFVTGLVGLGYRCVWRCFNAKHFGVPQRRGRVLLVGHFDWRRAAAVLFDRQSLRWDFAPSRKQGCDTASQHTEKITVVNARETPVYLENCSLPLGAKDYGHAVFIGDNPPRRLTPLECERLQGFPDGYTGVPHNGKPMADGPRYRMLGNSMAVPVMRWIGERIEMVDSI